MIVLPEREKIAAKNTFPDEIIEALDAFYTVAAAAGWQTPLSVKQTFPTADILKNDRVLFDIENQYHLLVKINYQMQAIRVLHFDKYGKLPQLLLNF